MAAILERYNQRFKMRTSLKIVSAVAVWLSALPFCFAGVIVNENVSPGATSWPGSPMAISVTNPASSSVIESFNGGGGCTNYTETFTVTTTNWVLDKISIYAGGGSGTSATTNLILKLYDLGVQTAPNPSPYTGAIIGSCLLGSGSGLSVTYANQALGVIEFDFTGTDEVTLTNGHLYAFELNSGLNTFPVFWDRGTNDTYSGGAAYRNQSWINGNSARDFAMAVYANVFTNTTTVTNVPFVPSGIDFHGFNGTDGANPAAGLLYSGGVLCGTTMNGGAQGAGTAFYMTPDASTFSTFRSFANSPDAGNPQGDLISSPGRFFGTSFGGGASGVGSVFVGQTNGTLSVIRNFTIVSADNATNSGGASPGATIASTGNTLFGVTSAGGVSANGTLFSITTNGTAFSVLYNFSALDCGTGTNTDGATPWGSLVLNGDTLYGTASAGGAGGNGLVFSVKTNGTGFTALHYFTSMDLNTATNTDGAIPYGGLSLLSNVLYGTTSAGGYGGSGTIFSIGTNGTGFAVLHHFSSVSPTSGTNVDGARPSVALMSAGHFLYGTAPIGGVAGNGTVFSLNLNNSQFTTLHSFSALGAGSTNNDGAFPVGDVVVVGNTLYGTTFSGGPSAAGIVFSVPVIYPTVIQVVSGADGSGTLFFTGSPGSTNVIQTATNLVPTVSWQNISTNIADINGEWQVNVTNSPAIPKFYRSFAQ